MRRYHIILGTFLAVFLLSPSTQASGSTQFIRIPATLNGPSGLLFTQSVDTLPTGSLEVSVGIQAENTDTPNDYTEYVTSATFSIGLLSRVEAALQVPYIAESDKTGKDERGIGDVNLSLKWRIFDPNTNFNFPGFALSLTGFFPTGDTKTGTGEIDSWGLRALLVSSAEIEITLFSHQMLMGVYADGGIYLQDSGDPTEEKYGIVDLGVLIPLVESRQLQLLIEGNARLDRQTFVPANADADYKAVTTGLRYAAKHIVLTAGWQHRFNEKPNEDTDLAMLQGSFRF